MISMQDALRIPIQLDPDATPPRYQTDGAAGLDLCAAEDAELGPMQRKLIRTGVRMAIPPGYEGQVRPRSGLALKHGLTMVNTPGTIDSDYRGEIGLIMINLGDEPFRIRSGERLAQLVICKIERAELFESETLDATARGEGGFGSTGST